ncbi:MAG: TlpA family protein disulfide reductase [Nannocystaceae bacterium]|nr:thioredoxin family protein [bacterium]
MRCAPWILCTLLLGCSGKPSEPASEASRQVAEASKVAKPRFVPAAEGADVAAEVRNVVAASADETVVVYVGASWCGPCQAFHAALERGELDEALAGVKFLEYDADRDRERLEVAGYGGRLIPRFAMPGPDGKFGGQKIEGGIKGDGAVEHIMKRLLPLLGSDAPS